MADDDPMRELLRKNTRLALNDLAYFLGDGVDVDSQALATRFADLKDLGQAHLFSEWPAAGTDDDRKVALLQQLKQLDESYPGGLKAYIASARKLLGASQRGENPLAGWKPSVPADGYDLAPGTPVFEKYERAGLAIAEAGALGFVVPAGGLGERLGFKGMKFALPAETSSGTSVLGVYCEYIRALEKRAAQPVTLPLAIMVSDDTETGITELLEANAYYGLKKAQVSLMKQEKVAALRDADAGFALSEPYAIATKPHGHGDIHFLLNSSGVARRWAEAGVRYMHFFQDTNTNYFSTFLATLGVSAEHGLAVNMVATPRKAKEAIGALCLLTHDDGRTMVANVEYNQLEPLMLASGFPEGDVNEADGYSRFPGSINQLIFDLAKWQQTVETTGGAIDEFINPKYTDGTRTAFKSPTRLECMMQDFVKTVGAGHVVGWTRFPPEYGYYPCKNDILSAAKLSASGVPPGSASSAEMAVYRMHAAQLRAMGCVVGGAASRSFRGVEVECGASIVLAPTFAPCYTLLRPKLSTPARVRISSKSSLVVRGADVTIEHLELDGALVIDVADGGSLHIVTLTVRNAGWLFEEMSDADFAAAPEEMAIRGFTLTRHATRTIKVEADQHIVLDGKVGRPTALAPLSTGKTRKSLQVGLDKPPVNHAKDKEAEGGYIDPNSLQIKVESNDSTGCKCSVM